MTTTEPMDFDKSVSYVHRHWGKKTLEDLRGEAEGSMTGIMFNALKAENAVQGSRRMVIIICLTSREGIEMVERAFNLANEGNRRDWREVTLLGMFSDTAAGGGMSYQDVAGEGGRRTAVALCATAPKAVQMIETLFDIK